MKPLPGALAGLPNLWRGGQREHAVEALPTGHARLDACLPGGGWPVGALTELIGSTPGAGEFSLLLPAIGEATRRGRWVVLVDPPWVPYPPGLAGRGVALERLLWVRGGSPREGLWACEQALRDLAGGIVVAWPEHPGFARLRRLQMAARAGGHAVFLFRPPEALRGASPAALRLGVEARGRDTCLTVHKCRGERPRGDIRVRRAQVPGLARLRAGPAVLTDGEAALPYWPHEAGVPPRSPLLDRAAFPAPGPGPRHPRPADASAGAGGHRRRTRASSGRH